MQNYLEYIFKPLLPTKKTPRDKEFSWSLNQLLGGKLIF